MRASVVGRLREKHRELVAADAKGVVGLAQRLGEDAAKRDERLVAGGVAVPVVQLLEVVEVRDHEAERAAVARRPRDLALEACRRRRGG